MAMTGQSFEATTTPSSARRTAQSPSLAPSYQTAVANAAEGVRAEVSIEQSVAYSHRLIEAFAGLERLPDSKPLDFDPDDL